MSSVTCHQSHVIQLAAFESQPGDIISIIYNFCNPQVACGQLRWRKSVDIPGGYDWAFIDENVIVTKSSYPIELCLIFVDCIQCGVFLLKSLGLGLKAFISGVRIITQNDQTQIFIGVRQPGHSLVAVVNLDGSILHTTKSFKFNEFDAGREFIVSYKNVLQVRNRRSNRPPSCVIEIRNHSGDLQCSWRSHLFGQELQTDKFGFVFLIGSSRAPRDTIEKYDRFGNLLLSLYTGRHVYVESPLMICNSPIRDTFFVATRFKILRYDGIDRVASLPLSSLSPLSSERNTDITAIIDFTCSYIIGITTMLNGNLLILSMDFSKPNESSIKKAVYVHCYQ